MRLLNDAVRQALAVGRSATGYERTIDITTTGARSGRARRIETWFYCIDGRYYLTGVTADLPARATPVDDVPERRRIFAEVLASQPDNHAGIADPAEIERWVAGSPLVEVSFAT